MANRQSGTAGDAGLDREIDALYAAINVMQGQIAALQAASSSSAVSSAAAVQSVVSIPASLVGLSDVAVSATADGDALLRNGNYWTNVNLPTHYLQLVPGVSQSAVAPAGSVTIGSTGAASSLVVVGGSGGAAPADALGIEGGAVDATATATGPAGRFDAALNGSASPAIVAEAGAAEALRAIGGTNAAAITGIAGGGSQAAVLARGPLQVQNSAGTLLFQMSASNVTFYSSSLSGQKAGNIAGTTSGVLAAFTSTLTMTVYDFGASGTGRTGLKIIANGTAVALGFYGATPVIKPAVTGSRGANAALASALSALASQGLITDSSTV